MLLFWNILYALRCATICVCVTVITINGQRCARGQRLRPRALQLDAASQWIQGA